MEELNNNSNKIERDEHGRLQKGVILNPNGRPKGARNFTTVVEEALAAMGSTEKGEKVEIKKALGEQVVRMALAGNEQMIKLIWNYLDGMPNQNINLSNTDELRREYFDKLKALEEKQ